MHWNNRINLNLVISEMTASHDLDRQEDACPGQVLEAIATEVGKAPELQEFVERVRNCQCIAAVNRLLREILEAADERKVWCGLP